MPLGHASGDFFMQLECEVCLSGEGWGMKVNIWETSAHRWYIENTELNEITQQVSVNREVQRLSPETC